MTRETRHAPCGIALLFALCGAGFVPAAAAEPAAVLVQLLDYLSVDYPEAVQNGQVVNAAEYEEMLEFSAAAVSRVSSLPQGEAARRLAGEARQLQSLVAQRAPVEEVRRLTSSMRTLVLAAFDVRATPAAAPDLKKGAALFAEFCVSCHGTGGAGDGPLAANLDPAPTDFTDVERYRQRSLYGLYATIGAGVEGTAMPPFAQLPESDRWNLAFYAGSLAAPKGGTGLPDWAELTSLVTQTAAELEEQHPGEGEKAAAAFRHAPELLFSAAEDSALARSRADLAAALEAYRQGEQERAYALALSAYLEGFELIESALDTVDPQLRHATEDALLAFRAGLQQRLPAPQVEEKARSALNLLDQAEARLGQRGLSGAAAFTASFLILLREGLEALLVVAALLAFLIKTGRREGLPYLHAGWMAALVAGFGLWWLSSRYITVGGADRELAEGFAALLAAAVMFYLGFWMHSRSSAKEWQRYIQQNMNRILSKGSLWGLAGISFIAVFRECFETVLFYQALFTQTDSARNAGVLAGIGAAGLVLAALAFLGLRFSARLPLREFFGATGILLFALSVIFAGKGIAALQETGRLPLARIPAPEIDWLGIYPSALSLSIQAAMIVAGLLLWRRSRTAA